MVKMNNRVHDLMVKGGFQYDTKRDRYFMRGEAEWDVEKRIQQGRRQLAVPAKTKEEFIAGEEKMVDDLLKRLKEKAAKEAASKPASKPAPAEEEGEEPPAKKPKKQKDADEAEAEEEAETKPKKDKKKKKQEEEEE
eukprot:CAMPEP_0168470870 /NCGR_PEP_ID=MMETSP0228-20121227/58973_1 /TAXON_ID=133427 /ORGANISM="Protoceratium reticulatum, Strain CCCM 535 (=CCMP 1889)" /LENGTH=136 /DNA_ID=CAMNT_0008486729 /DNA_START=71 /DNA_END=481 /DNA_ORIENTATION=-